MPALGSEDYTCYLHDRGGGVRLATFDHVWHLNWQRKLNGVSVARVGIALPTGDQCCSFLSQMRSIRHELVIYRGGQRIWEGPITRIEFGVEEVMIHASDVAWWLSRRSHRGLFTDAINGVKAAELVVTEALKYDDPNIGPFLRSASDGAPAVVLAVNPYEQDYLDSLEDLAEQGVNWTVLGRAITLWPATQQIGLTQTLGSGDLIGDISVIEDGQSLATRTALTYGETWGASSPEKSVTNWATNPSLEASLTGFEAAASWWTLSLVSTAWGRGARAGQIVAGGPADPGASASEAAKEAYATTVSDFDKAELMLTAKGQKIAVHEGELISAILYVRHQGPAPLGTLGLSLTSVDYDGVVSDRAFAEGPPISVGATSRMLFCQGQAPADSAYAFVSVWRQAPASDNVARWKLRSGSGFQFDMLGIFRGRIESWFDGATADSADFDFAWTGGTNTSTSVRTFKDAGHHYVDNYYGLVEQVATSSATTSASLAVAADTWRDSAFPAPMSLDIPQNAPLSPKAPITLDQLVPGVTIPVRSSDTCRELTAPCLLEEVSGEWGTDSGEVIDVTLTSGLALQEFTADEENNPDAVLPPPGSLPAGGGSGGATTPGKPQPGKPIPPGPADGGTPGKPKPPTPAPPVKRAWSSSPTLTLAIKSIPGAYSYLQDVTRIEAEGGQPVQYVMSQDVKGDTRFLLFNANGSYAGQWMIVKDGGHGSSFHAYREPSGRLIIWTLYKSKAYRYAWQSGKTVGSSGGSKADFKGGRPVGSHEPYVGFRTATSTKETFYLFNRNDFLAGKRNPRRQVTLSKRTSPVHQTEAVTDTRIYRLRGHTNQDVGKGSKKHLLDVLDWKGSLLLSNWDITKMIVASTSDEPEGLTFTGTPGNLMIGKREGGAKANRSYPIWTITGLP